MVERHGALQTWQRESREPSKGPQLPDSDAMLVDGDIQSPGRGWTRMRTGSDWTPCPLGTTQPGMR